MSGLLSEEDGTDIGQLWEQALESYAKESGTSLKQLDQAKWNISTILADQDRQLQVFTEFRHNKGKVDKLRSLVSSNSNIIVGVAEHVAGAATAAFPPAAAILTAFTFVMSASKAVSDDYDMICSFFDIMNSFLERLQILEAKLPDSKNFKAVIMRVFASLLSICAIARKYRVKGRFVRWAKNLVDNGDPELKASYDALHKHLQRLESATIMATLAQTIQTSRDIKGLSAGIDQQFEQTSILIRDGIVQTIETKGFAREAAITSAETLAVVRGMGEGNDSLKELVERKFSTFERKLRDRDGTQKKAVDGLMDSGARKSTAMNEVRRKLANSRFVDWRTAYVETRHSYVSGTFEWISADEGFRDLLDENTRMFWIAGAPGMGKSTLASVMVERIQGEFGHDSSISVAHFFYKDEKAGRNAFENVLCAWAVQAAEQDVHYREDILADMQRRGNWTDRGINGFRSSDCDDLSETLFFSKYTKGSDRRLILVIDGVEEATAEEATLLRNFMFKAVGAANRIQLILTSASDFFTEPPSFAYKHLDLVKGKILKDMRTITAARIKSSAKLRKLTPKLRGKMTFRLRQKADNLRYIEHMIRRFTSLGREGPIWKELDNLPENTTALYEQLLDECQRYRSDRETEVLRQFYAWMAYSKDDLTLGMAKKLVQILAKDNSINIDEELDTKSSRLLRLTVPSSDADQAAESSETEDDASVEEEGGHDEEPDTTDEDYRTWLGFQEPSLRAYFREKDVTPSGLRSSPSVGHTIILEVLAGILTDDSIPEISTPNERLRAYATEQWLPHLRDIASDDLEDDKAEKVITSLYSILSNRGSSLKQLEQVGFNVDTSHPSVFSAQDSSHDDLGMLQKWAARAIRFTGGTLPSSIVEWMRPFVQTPSRIFISLARGHLSTWFGAENQYDAELSFRHAHEALYRGRDLPELKQNRELREYFNEFEELEKDDKFPTVKSLQVVSDAFWDIPKTPRAHMAIGMALKWKGFLDEGIAELRKGLEQAPDSLESFDIHTSISTGMFDQIDSSKNAEAKDAKITETWNMHEETLRLYHLLPEKMKESEDVKFSISVIYGDRISMTVLRNNINQALDIIHEAKEGGVMVLEAETTAVFRYLARENEWAKIIAELKAQDQKQVQWALWYSYDDEMHRLIQRAAKETGEEVYIINLYNDGIDKRWEESVWGSSCRIREAEFLWTVLRKPEDCERAKSIINKLIDYTKITNQQISEACFLFTDILMEDFRKTNDPISKTRTLDQMKTLKTRMTQAMGRDFDPTQSQTSIPLAIMTRKLGPTINFQQDLDLTFKGCIECLTDTTGWNDGVSLRTLAKVLSCLPGLEREAQIAATCQVYVLDVEVYMNEMHGGEDAADNASQTATEQTLVNASESAKGPVVPEQELPTSTDQPSVKIETPNNGETEVTTVAATPATPTTDTKETPADAKGTDIDPAAPTPELAPAQELPGLTSIFCKNCAKALTSWAEDGAMYLCCYCTELVLCEECYNKKLARERGELKPEWRTLCAEGHKHVKMPVDGWDGLESGIMKIGDTQVPFKEWLKDLQDVKWPRAWDRFWSEGEVVSEKDSKE